MRRYVIVFMGVCCTVAPPAAAQRVTADAAARTAHQARVARQEREAPAWTWSGTMSEGDTLRLRLVRGEVRVRTVPDRDAMVTISRRARRSDPRAVRVVVDSADHRVTIEDRYPRRSPSAVPRECLPPTGDRGDFWNSDVRLEASVAVPDGARLIVDVMEETPGGYRPLRPSDGEGRGGRHAEGRRYPDDTAGRPPVSRRP